MSQSARQDGTARALAVTLRQALALASQQARQRGRRGARSALARVLLSSEATRVTMGNRNELYVRGQVGFRLWWSDLVVLALAGGAAVWAWEFPLNPGAAVITVVGHYFLFCNVTRMRGLYELLWALSYSFLSVWLVGGGRVTWAEMALVIAPLTVSLTVAEVQSPRYRGVFAGARDGVEGAEPPT